MNAIRKYAAVLLALILTLSAVPFTASAAEPVPVASTWEGVSSEETSSTTDSRLDIKTQSEETLPASYDMRVSAADHLPPIRNQGPYGMCWTFSVMASAESSLIDKGLADNSIDLSEMHLSYYTFNHGNDPMNLSNGDYSKISSGHSMIDVGGNSRFATYTLARWFGAAPESAMPYSDIQYICGAQYPDFYSTEMDFGHMQNAMWISMRDDADGIKRYIMEHGTVGTYYYQVGQASNDDGGSYNPQTYAYYQTQSNDTNHAVAIVGWDDNFSKDNFLATNRPEGDGAWLIRNSRGTGDGNNGYFWLSYYDTSIAQYGYAYAFDFESSDNYDHNYQYDGSSGLTTISVEDCRTALTANVFTSQQDETLEAISYAIPGNTNVNYEVDIYLNPSDPGNPTSGMRVVEAHTEGVEKYAGYYTVKLPTPVALTAGTKFAVVVCLTAPYGEDINVAVDRSYKVGSYYEFHSDAKAGQSLYSFNGGNYWADEGQTKGGNFRIKAFTKENGIERPTGLTATHNAETSEVTLNWAAFEAAQSYEIEAMPEDGTEFSTLTTVTGTSYTYTPSEDLAGQTIYYRVRAVKASGSTDWSAISSVRLPIIKYLYSYEFEEIELTMSIGDTQQLHPSFSPKTASDKKLSYYSDNSAVATVSPTGLITAVGSGSTLIHSVSRSGGYERSIPVFVPREIQCTSLEQLQSAHNYANNLDEKYVYKAVGAASVTLTFSSDTVLTYYDTIRIYNAKGEMKGPYYFSQLSGQTITLMGDTAIIRLTTDTGSTAYGFRVESISTSQDTNFPTEISITSLPDKMTYFEGETFDSTGLTLLAKYSDGTTKPVTEGFSCSPSTLTWAGTQEITVSYAGKTAKFNIAVTKVAVSSIRIKTPPTQTKYFRYDSINTAGLEVEAIYNNGSTKPIDEGYSLSETYFPETGTFAIAVSYDGFEASFDITVEDPVVTGIHIVDMPDKLEYEVGDMIDTTGMKIWADYNDGYPEMNVTGGFTCTPEFFNKPGKQTVTVWYKGQSTEFEVTVTGEAEEITISPVVAPIRVGGTADLTAAYKLSTDAPTVVWSSSNPAIASVDSTGHITANRQGNVIITASDGTISASIGIQVLPVLSSLSIYSKSGSFVKKVSWWKSYSSASLDLGHREYNLDGAVKFVWSSNNSKVKVNQSGHVTNTGSFSRSAVITVTAYAADGSKIRSTSVTVRFYKF